MELIIALLIVIGLVAWLVRLINPPVKPSNIPAIPNLVSGDKIPFYLEGLIRGLLIMGKPGSGKTHLLAWIIVEYMRADPEVAILVFDASGDLKKKIVGRAMALKEPERSAILNRIGIDIPFHPDGTLTMPEFHKSYEMPFEAQVQRVAGNLKRLNPVLATYGIMGLPMLEEGMPQMGRLLCAIENQHGDTWQLTEAKTLFTNRAQLAIALGLVGMKVPSAKYYFEPAIKTKLMDPRDWEMRTYGVRSALGVLEAQEMRARIGFYAPSYTIPKKEIIGILQEVIRQLTSIPFGPVYEAQDQPENMMMHYCTKCKSYHRVKES